MGSVAFVIVVLCFLRLFYLEDYIEDLEDQIAKLDERVFGLHDRAEEHAEKIVNSKDTKEWTRKTGNNFGEDLR